MCLQSASQLVSIYCSCRCRLELTEEMLKVKQAPAVALMPPAAADIETGIPISTSTAADGLDPPLNNAPTVLVIPSVHDRSSSNDCQLNLEAVPGVAVRRDTTNQPPIRCATDSV